MPGSRVDPHRAWIIATGLTGSRLKHFFANLQQAFHLLLGKTRINGNRDERFRRLFGERKLVGRLLQEAVKRRIDPPAGLDSGFGKSLDPANGRFRLDGNQVAVEYICTVGHLGYPQACEAAESHRIPLGQGTATADE